MLCDAMRACARIGAVTAACSGALSTGHALGQGFTAGNGQFVGVALTAGEKANVVTALDKLQALANAETNAQNKATMQRVIDCVANMNRNGQIGRETGTSTDEAVTLQDGTCACEADEMNINAEALQTGEPYCSNLADSLMHEGIHTIQWAMPGSPYAGTEDKEEWVAYAWGKYALKKLLANPALTAEQRAYLQQKLKIDCGNEQTYCATATGISVNDILQFLNDWFAKEGQQKKRLIGHPTYWYQSTYPFSGKIELVNGTTGATARTVDTLFPVHSGLAPYLTTSGREAFFVGSADSGFTSGTLVRFMDIDGDGMVDQSSRTTFTLPGGAIPIALQPFGSTLWVLAAAGPTAQRVLFSIPDTNADGLPDPAAATIFANAAAMPTLANVRTFRVLSPTQIIGSALEGGMRVVNSRLTYYTFTDTNNDHIADTATSTPFDSTRQPFIPQPMQWMDAGDTLLLVQAHTTAALQVLHTDASGGTLEIIGTSPPSSGLTRPVELFRPLNLGEYLVLFDQTHNLRSPVPTQARPPIAEILGINLTDTLPGALVQLTTRNVIPGSVQVRCSGQTAQIVNQTPTQVVFVAPTAAEIPSGHVAVELVSPQGTSYPVGLLIDGDCNHNGIADLQDVRSGASRDINLDSVPDECECLADFNGDGAVNIQDVFDFLAAWFGGDPTTRYHGGSTTSINDIFDFLAVWFAGCH